MDERRRGRMYARQGFSLWFVGFACLLSAGSFAQTITVTTLADSGAGSFRQAIIDSNASGSDLSIDFSVTGVITLQSSLPALTSTLYIEGPGAGSLTIDGVNAFEIFKITNSATVEIRDLTIANGLARGGNGQNGEDDAVAPGSGGGGGAGMGGGVFADSGHVGLGNIVFLGCSAIAGAGGNGGAFAGSSAGSGGKGGDASHGVGTGGASAAIGEFGSGGGGNGGKGGFGGGGGGGGGVAGTLAGAGGTGAGSGGGGGAGMGGGLFLRLEATALLKACTFENNVAIAGGSGGGSTAGTMGEGHGGGFFVSGGVGGNMVLSDGITFTNNSATTTGDDLFGVILLAPFIIDMTRDGSFSTNDAQASFTATFSEAVVGVDTSDFEVVMGKGVTGASIESVTNIDDVSYTVVVNTGTGDGFLSLKLVDDDSISNAVAVPLGGAGVAPRLGSGDSTNSDTIQIDRTPPTITVNGDSMLTLECSVDTYTELGALASDEGGFALVFISGDIVMTDVPGTYVVEYTAADGAGNSVSDTRTVVVQDATPPTLALNGPAAMTLEIGVDTYTELGAIASDACDMTISTVIAGDLVDDTIEGVYLVTYDSIDAAGLMATQLTRTVQVVPMGSEGTGEGATEGTGEGTGEGATEGMGEQPPKQPAFCGPGASPSQDSGIPMGDLVVTLIAGTAIVLGSRGGGGSRKKTD